MEGTDRRCSSQNCERLPLQSVSAVRERDSEGASGRPGMLEHTLNMGVETGEKTDYKTMIRKHCKLYILIATELVVILAMIAGSFGDAAAYSFTPSDFEDNVQGRNYISTDEEMIHFSYNPAAVRYDDEGRIIGDDLKTGKFAIGSGAYDIVVDYEAGVSNAYVELYSESRVTETVSPKIQVIPDKNRVSAKVYIPFGRSMHDIQMNIHYTGPDDLTVYSIKMAEDVRYRWVPVAGYILLFTVLDLLLWLIFARSAGLARSIVRTHYEIPCLIFIVMIASLPLVADFLYVGHDMDFHLARIIAVSHEISYGQFPVRMLTDMLKGYSYPTSTFYCDLFMYPFVLLYLVGIPLRMCWQIYILTVNISTALISYFCFKRISDSRDIALVGTAVYTLSAYRIVDLYLRSAKGKFTAMVFLPLVVLGIWIIYFESKERKDGWVYLGLGMTSLALCHLLSLEMISMFLIFFCLMEYKKTFTGECLIQIGKAALMTLLLSCWFIIPMLLSMRGIDLSMYTHQFFIQFNGAYPSQVFNPFMRGTGYSTLATPMEMPLSIGGGIITAFVLLLFLMIRGIGDGRRQKTMFSLVAISLIFSMYFFPWDSIAGITEGRIDAVSRLARMVQYPWRFLEITTILLAVAAVSSLSIFKSQGNTGAVRGWASVLLLGTVISLASFYDPFINEADWTRAADENYIESSIGGEEYLPAEAGRLVDLKYELETIQGNAEVLSYESINGERRIAISNAGDDAKILIPLFAYPGFSAQDEATGTEIAMSMGDGGRAELTVPAGYTGTVRVFYKEPALWRVFEAVSLISLIVYILLFIRRKTGSDKRSQR